MYCFVDTMPIYVLIQCIPHSPYGRSILKQFAYRYKVLSRNSCGSKKLNTMKKAEIYDINMY